MASASFRLCESALIKSIRRGLTDDAVYWGARLYGMGKAELVWRRLLIHVSEDIGLAERTLPATIHALHVNYLKLTQQLAEKASYEAAQSDRLPLIHAIMLMATAEKSRAVDHAITVHFHPEGARSEKERPIPEYAIDFHSPMGRRMGRDVEHFLHEGAHLENVSSHVRDEWKARAFRILAHVMLSS